jgi:hypothetical protein
MRSAIGQFVLGFVVTFSPAPFVGFGTYAFVQGQDAPEASSAPAVPRTYRMPADREFGTGADALQIEEAAPAEERHAQPGNGGMEIEIECGRRKRVKKEAEKPKAPPVPDL